MSAGRIVVVGLALLSGLVGGSALAQNRTQWACGAEDEVVIIDSSCRHADELSAP